MCDVLLNYKVCSNEINTKSHIKALFHMMLRQVATQTARRNMY